MTFKPAIWYPIALLLTAVNLAGAGWAVRAGESLHAMTHIALTLVFAWWAQRLKQGQAATGNLAQLQQQLDEQADALEDARSRLAGQATQLAELHERVDFAERVLTQVRERSALKNPDERK